VVGLLITELRKVIAKSESEKKLKSVNIWQSYKQKRDCLVHVLRLFGSVLDRRESALDNHALACNFANIHRFKKKKSTHTLSKQI